MLCNSTQRKEEKFGFESKSFLEVFVVKADYPSFPTFPSWITLFLFRNKFFCVTRRNSENRVTLFHVYILQQRGKVGKQILFLDSPDSLNSEI